LRKLRIGILDLVAKCPNRSLFARLMNANLASIMPQVIAAWCEQEGHVVTFVCYTGLENLVEELPDNVELVFIGAFTEAAQLAYALSNLFRSRGAITVIGGPHARCYPQDALKYFDYVLGFTDKVTIRDVLQDCCEHRPIGMHVAARQQPTALPGVRERWKFIESTLRKAPLKKIDLRGLPPHQLLQLCNPLPQPISFPILCGLYFGAPWARPRHKYSHFRGILSSLANLETLSQLFGHSRA